MTISPKSDPMSRAPVRIDPMSRVPVRVETFFEDTPLGVATGFFFRHEELDYFVTNWHVVSGRHREDLRCLHQKAGLPTRFLLHIPYSRALADDQRAVWGHQFELTLYEDKSNQVAKWLEHPSGHSVDLVAFPFRKIDNVSTELLAANDPSLELADIEVRPGLDVFIIGYPRGIRVAGHFPIWKRGSIASDPDVDVDGPYFLVDAATREGMSGSPVYAEQSGVFNADGSRGFNSNTILGKARRLVGVYASRDRATDEFEAQLGMVWKLTVLEEILRSKVPGKSRFSL